MTFDLIVLALLILASGFFSTTETALFSLTRQDLVAFKNSGNSSLTLIQDILKAPNRVLISLMLGNNSANIMLVLWSTHVLHDITMLQNLLANSQGLGILVEIIGITGVILIFGEIIPKSVALSHPARIAQITVVPFFVFHKIMAILRVQLLLAALNKMLLNLIRKIFGEKEESANFEDIQMVMELSAKDGHVAQEEASIIDGILDLKKIPIGEIMLDRSSVTTFAPEDSLQKAISIGMKNPHNEYPVYDAESDKVMGILNVENCFLMGSGGKVQESMHPPDFMPTVNTSEFLLDILIKKTDKIYVVVDEFGAYVGIISYLELESFLTKNAIPVKEQPYSERIQVTKSAISIQADIKLDELESFLKCKFPEGDYHTLGGMLMHYSGKIPQKNEWVVVEGWKFYIEKARLNRVEQVLISLEGVEK